MSNPKYNYCVYWWKTGSLEEDGFKEVRTKKEADKMISTLRQMGYSSRLHRGTMSKF